MKAILLAKAGLVDRKEYALEEGKAYLVGRSREADVIVKDRLASRNHCKIAAADDDEWTVADLGSSNGTYVNRERVTTRLLRSGDTIQIGKSLLEFHVEGALPASSGRPTQRIDAQEREAPVQLEVLQPAPEAPAPAAPPPGNWQGPEERAATARPPHAEPPRAEPPPRPKGEPVDEDIRGLFDFLDKVGPGGRPPAEEGKPAATSLDSARPGLAKEPPAESRASKGAEDEGLFSLLDDLETPAPEPRESDPEKLEKPPAADEGGLLAFLRKKKQQP